MAGSVGARRRLSHSAHSQHGAECAVRPYGLHGRAQWRYPDYRCLEALADLKYAVLHLYLAALYQVVCQLLYSRSVLAYTRVSPPLLPDLCVRPLLLRRCPRQSRASDGLAPGQSQHPGDLRLCVWHGADVCVAPGGGYGRAGLRRPFLWHGQLAAPASPAEPGAFAAGQGAVVSHPGSAHVRFGAVDYGVLVRAGDRYAVGWPPSAPSLALLRGAGAAAARSWEICDVRLRGGFCLPPGDIRLCQRLR